MPDNKFPVDENEYREIRDLLVLHEDKRRKLYKCSAGKLTIGIGRNIEDNGLRDDEIEYLFRNDVAAVIGELKAKITFWDKLSPARKRILIDMGFNMGIARLMGFKKMLEAMSREDWKGAVAQMKDSAWWRQLSPPEVEKRKIVTRPMRLANMMISG